MHAYWSGPAGPGVIGQFQESSLYIKQISGRMKNPMWLRMRTELIVEVLLLRTRYRTGRGRLRKPSVSSRSTCLSGWPSEEINITISSNRLK